jgi:hypothetical protein
MSTDTWQPFGIPDEAYTEAADGHGQKILNISWRRSRAERKATGQSREADPSRGWLRSALVGLGVLAAAAAAVSFAAQYHLVFAAKDIPWASALEAGIPDAGSMVFACLGIALALKGKRALRARGGNLACVGLSLTMNLIAAAAGWRGIAIWVMPSAVYAFASDTLIGVIRAHQLARLERDDDEKTALAALGGLILWTLRLTLAPKSTLSGFRGWVIEAAPVAPGSTAAAEVTAPIVAALPAAPEKPGSVATSRPEPQAAGRRPAGDRPESKRAQLIKAYEALRGQDPRFGVRSKASEVARELATDVGLEWGSARSYLYRHLDTEAAR